MKRILFCILLLASLTACSATSSGGTLECNKQQGVCIYIKAEEPIIAGEPVTVTITVKGEKDIPDLQIGLSANGNVFFEESELKTWKKTGIGWNVNLKAKKEHTSKHKVLLPSEDGYYTIVASVFTADYGRIASNWFDIVIAGKERKVYYPGTKVPGAEGPIIGIVYTVTPGPSPTPIVESTVPSYP